MPDFLRNKILLHDFAVENSLVKWVVFNGFLVSFFVAGSIYNPLQRVFLLLLQNRLVLFILLLGIDVQEFDFFDLLNGLFSTFFEFLIYILWWNLIFKIISLTLLVLVFSRQWLFLFRQTATVESLMKKNPTLMVWILNLAQLLDIYFLLYLLFNRLSLQIQHQVLVHIPITQSLWRQKPYEPQIQIIMVIW